MTLFYSLGHNHSKRFTNQYSDDESYVTSEGETQTRVTGTHRWLYFNNSYFRLFISSDEDVESQTEGEEFEKARERRRQEVKLQPLPYLPTDTETEVSQLYI